MAVCYLKFGLYWPKDDESFICFRAAMDVLRLRLNSFVFEDSYVTWQTSVFLTKYDTFFSNEGSVLLVA